MKSSHDFWDSAFRKLAQRGAQEFPSIFEEEMALSGEFLSMIPRAGRVMDFGAGVAGMPCTWLQEVMR